MEIDTFTLFLVYGQLIDFFRFTRHDILSLLLSSLVGFY